ncbi:Transcription initiation factor IIA, gamma subunit [Penicillium digitatum]|uniref:Transcription initiation factor IIA subunit 2 n=1 Tax=Penicillium digitatum TaxID=36651 RepID=A0A7T6XG62_PENDI|nr:Transcription initiation factor IIA, gamma subunit [Penicillium digitatum]
MHSIYLTDAIQDNDSHVTFVDHVLTAAPAIWPAILNLLLMASVAYYELYRGSSLGLSLTDTLDDLINEGRIEPQLAMKILGTFDKIVTEVLADKVRARLTFKGHLDTYRFCDEVWTFLIKDVSFKLDNQTTVSADKVKIVSCNSKRPGEV